MSKTLVNIEYDYTSIPKNQKTKAKNLNYTLFRKQNKFLSWIKSSKPVSLNDKIICSSCYFSFGLVGLVCIALNFIYQKRISKSIFVNTLQSVILSIIIFTSLFILSAFNSISSLLVSLIQSYGHFYPVLSSYVPFIIVAVTGFYAIAAFSGRYLPVYGVEKLAEYFLK